MIKIEGEIVFMIMLALLFFLIIGVIVIEVEKTRNPQSLFINQELIYSVAFSTWSGGFNHWHLVEENQVLFMPKNSYVKCRAVKW